MAELYIKTITESNNDSCEGHCCIPLESVITLFTYQYCNSKINLNLVKCEYDNSQTSFRINFSKLNVNFINEEQLPEMAKACMLPVVVIDTNTVIAGLCSVSRQITKISQKTDSLEYYTNLLGFRNACLMSPNESSIWTKFCEIDIITTVQSLVANNLNMPIFTIPVDLARFECHMRQPVRAHNVYKLANDVLMNSRHKSAQVSKITICENISEGDQKPTRICKQRNFKSSNINQSPKSSEIQQLEHKFAEGISLTLADIILFPCFYIVLKYLRQERLTSLLPLTLKWYQNLILEDNGRLKHSIDYLILQENTFEPSEIILPVVENYSLYKSDPKRYKPRKRNYTKQCDIENVLHNLSNVSFDIKKSENMPCLKMNFDWQSLPFEALPEGGNLPEKRRTRKAQQLENLAKATIEMAKPGDHIIDFCSGSGHLGIIIALMLPSCQISLLENKEESMIRAKARIAKLGLTNISFFQCNLDFFKANFQIGVSLHACGVATDLVMQHCIEKKADFVCCPCCYGNVHNCHHMTYPRSNTFKDRIELQDYLILGHGADQTHDVENVKTAQGELCMDLIDKDRILKAQECGYNVLLTKLHPPTCTPKNNLLIGRRRD